MTALPTTATPMNREDIDKAYDNAAAFPDVPQWRGIWQERSAAVPIGPAATLDIAYGTAPRQTLDIFPCGDRQASTCLFFHGGFWSRNAKETFRYTVRGIHAAGCHAVFVGYTLAPDARLDRIVDEARAAGQWMALHLREIGFAERPMIAAGWSAGAHLAAMMMGAPHIAAGIGISGVYDLEPMRHATLNDTLGLDEDEARRNTPALHLPTAAGPFTVAYGARELPAYRAQSEQFHAAWTGAGLPGALLPLPGHHHHSALDELYERDGRLVQALAQLAQFST